MIEAPKVVISGTGTFTPPAEVTDRLPSIRDWYSKHVFGSQIDESAYWLIQELQRTRDLLAQANERQNELLAALRHIVSVGCEYYDMECGENGGPAIEQAEAAIAKAEIKH